MRLASILVFVVGVVGAGCDSATPATAGTDGGAPDLSPDSMPNPVIDLATAPLPDMAGQQTTIIRVHYPAGGRAIAVRGSSQPLDWNTGIPLTAGPDDTFVYATNAITVPVEFKPLLDDKTWSRGANYLVNPGAAADVYPHFENAKGQVVKLLASFHSNALVNDRIVWAYLPPSYSENVRASYPVLYMHDGQNLFDPALAFGGREWMVDETLDAGAETLDRAQSIREMIVVAPENTARRVFEYTPTRDASVGDGGGGDLYLKMLVEELKPLVDQMLRTRPDRASTAILGSSLGGLISAYAGVRRPDVFGAVGAMSPSTWWDNRTILGDVSGIKGHAPRADRVYVDSGDAGPSNDDVANTNVLAQTYLDAGYRDGIDFMHVVQHGGQHNEVYWAQRLPVALRFLSGIQTP